MFALFYSLYMSMFYGSWTLRNLAQIQNETETIIKKLITILTSMFNNVSTPVTDMTLGTFEILTLVSFILALITSIGIVVMAVKGVKKAFGIFFMGIRR